MSDNPRQHSPGQRIPAGMAVNDKLHDTKLILSKTWENLCHFLFVKPLKVPYWNPSLKMQHAIAMEKCTVIHKGLMLFNNLFEGTAVLNVFKFWLNKFMVVKW